MKRSREIPVLIGILMLGALLRGLYLSEIAHNLDFSSPGVDAAYHDYWARGLATGNWAPPGPNENPHIQSTPYFRPPGYPYFLGLVYLWSNSSYLAARIVQMLLGLLSIFLAFLLGRRWLGSRVGLIFAGLMSFYWIFIYFEGELLEPVLLVPLSLLLVYELSLWTDKVTFTRAFLAGIILGVFALVRPNILLFAPVALIWALWVMRRRGDLRPIKVAAVGLALGSMLAISPATIRNYIVAHDFVPISSNGGINLYIGNNLTANGRVAGRIGDLGYFGTCFDYPQIVRNLEAKLGRPLKHSEVSAYFSGEAKTYMKAHPGDVLRLTGTRALLFWGPLEVGHNKEDEFERQNSRLLRYIPGNFAMAFSLAIIGTALLCLDSRRRRKAESFEAQRKHEVFVLVLLFVGVYFASYLPFFIAGRYRVPIVPFLLLLGACGIDGIWQFVVSRSFPKAALWMVALVATYALASVNFTGYQPDRAVWHFGRGVDLGASGKADRAIAEYTEALKLKPKFPQASTNLGLLLVDEGKINEAQKSLVDAISADPSIAWAHYGMGLVLSEQGKLNPAIAQFKEAIRLDPNQYSAHYQIGLVMLDQGRTPSAVSEFTQASKINPRFGIAYVALGMIMEEQGNLDEAAAHYVESLKADPNAYVHFKLGSIYARQRKIDEATREFQESVRMNPDDPQAQYNLGIALEHQKDLDGAIEHYSKTVQLQPSHAKAHKNLAVALYFKGDYAGAWKEVKLCRKYGAVPHPEFVKALAGKMPEPR